MESVHPRFTSLEGFCDVWNAKKPLESLFFYGVEPIIEPTPNKEEWEWRKPTEQKAKEKWNGASRAINAS